MLQAIHLSFGVDALGAPLIENLNLAVLPGQKLAVVGPNGAGKTTLLRVLFGQIAPHSGTVHLTRGTRLAYLQQELPSEGLLGDHLEDSPALRRSLHRLQVPLEFLDRTMQSLSPGERMRAMLALSLCEEPDVLLLDEPTNHLDSDGRAWLVAFLNRSREAIVFVSHDRAFVDAVADRTLELRRGEWFESSGGYSDLEDAKRERDQRLRSEYSAHKAEVARLKLVAERQSQKAAQVTRGPRGQRERGNKPYYAAMQAKIDRRANAVKTRVQQEESRNLRKPFEESATALKFPTLPLRSGFALQARGLSAKVGDRVLFDRIDFDLEPGERIALTGPNGSGKTTLIRGLLDPRVLSRGAVSWGVGARAGYLDQTAPKDDRSPSEIVGEAGRSLLGTLGLHGEIQSRPASTLSMGERTRVELVRLLMEGVNVLLLDEPTNHLDLPALEALEQALLQFPGAILFVSHDQRFVERLADRTIQLGEWS